MKTIKDSYQTVINHISEEMQVLQKSGQAADEVALELLRKRHQWLIHRREKLDEHHNRATSELHCRLEAYLNLCGGFWKEMHQRTYEDKLDRLLDAKRRVTRIYALSGFEACHELLVTLIHLRDILPLEQYDDHAPAVAALEEIKKACTAQLRVYLAHYPCLQSSKI